MEAALTFIAGDLFRGLVLLAGVLVAVISVVSARIIARRKQTIDALMASRTDTNLQDGLECVSAIHHKEDANLRAYAKPERRKDPEVDKLLFVLNHWEYVAIGVRKGIYDDDMFRIANQGTVTQLYDRARPFIEALREHYQRPMIFIEFETLAARWKLRPLKKPPTGFRWFMSYIGLIDD